MEKTLGIEEIIGMLSSVFDVTDDVTPDGSLGSMAKEEEIIIKEINLAGVDKSSIQVSVVPRNIVIGVDNNVHTRLSIEDGIKPELVEAKYENGMLTVEYPRHPKPHKVTIK